MAIETGINVFLTIIVEPNQKIFINDMTCIADKNGIVLIKDYADLRKHEDRTIAEFDRVLSSYLAIHQKKLFYDLLLNSNRIGLRETSILLSIETNLARDILTKGILHGLIKKKETQWQIESEKKNIIKQYIRDLTKEEEECVTSDGTLKDKPSASIQFVPSTRKTKKSAVTMKG